jgi:hypothetical protein
MSERIDLEGGGNANANNNVRGGEGGENACVRDGKFDFDAWWAMNQQNERHADAMGKNF